MTEILRLQGLLNQAPIKKAEAFKLGRKVGKTILMYDIIKIKNRIKKLFKFKGLKNEY